MKTKIYIKTHNKKINNKNVSSECDCKSYDRPFATSLTEVSKIKDFSKVESVFCKSCINNNLYSKFPKDKYEYVYQSRWMEEIPFFMEGYIPSIYVRKVTRKINIVCNCIFNKNLEYQPSFVMAERTSPVFEICMFKTFLPMKISNMLKDTGNFVFDEKCFIPTIESYFKISKISISIASCLTNTEQNKFIINTLLQKDAFDASNVNLIYVPIDNNDISPDWLNMNIFKNYEIIK